MPDPLWWRRVVGLVVTVWLATAPPVAAAPDAPAAVVLSRDDLPFTLSFEDLSAPVAEIAVIGVTRYAPRDLIRYALAHERASLGRTSVSGIVAAVELMYREDGYLLAEARSSVDASLGRVTITVAEGVVDRIRIYGLRDKVASAVLRYLRPLLHRPALRNDEFERAFMLASDLTGVYLKSDFSYDGESDGAILTITGGEQRQAGSLSADVVPHAAGTDYRTYVMEEGHGVARGGDLVRAFGLVTFDPGASRAASWTAFYRTAVGARGTYVEAFGGTVFARRQFAEVVARTEQTGGNGVVAIGHPIKRDLHTYAYVIGEVDIAHATGRLGPTRLDSEARVARLYWVQGHTRPLGGLVQWSVELSAGTRPDRPAGEVPDGDKRFAHLRAGLGVITALPAISDYAYVRVESSGQWTTRSLPALEKFGLGFQPHLRGYAPWEVQGDRGVAATVEASYLRPVASRGVREVMPFAFVDAGTVDQVVPVPGRERTARLWSMGAGARLAFAHGISAGTWVGVPLMSGPFSGRGEPGVYVRLTKAW